MNMTKVVLVAALAAGMPDAAAAQHTAETYERLPSVDLPPELDRVLRDYESAWAAGDEAALAALFTDDGFVPTHFGWVRGRETIRDVYETSSGPLQLRAVAFHVDGSAGYIVGAYNYVQPTDGIDGGKFLLAVRRDDTGRWLIAADLDSGNRR